MKISINTHLINKNEANVGGRNFTHFQSFDLSPAELADHISQGHAFSFQFEGEHRKAKNFLCSDVIAADIDKGMSLDEALSNEFVMNNASIVYTTPSHTEENNKFRVVFQLPKTITDGEELRAAQRGLAQRLLADYAATDPARIFYGCNKSSPTMIGKILSNEHLNDLIKLGTDHSKLSDSKESNPHAHSVQRSHATIDKDRLIKDTSGNLRKLSDIPKSTSVFCPFHEDEHASALITQSKDGSPAIHCSTCQCSFWLKEHHMPAYEFNEFDAHVIKSRAEFVPTIYTEREALVFETSNPYHIFSSQYLSDVLEASQIQPGFTFIKSPKGTGKTEYLKRLVNYFHKHEKKHRILVIGHRRSLLKAMAEKLGLELYLDADDTPRGPSKGKGYAICLDSMATLLQPNRDRFNVVLLDESEQVISHLISETIDRTRRTKCYRLLQHYINRAGHVVALDADMDVITPQVLHKIGTVIPMPKDEHTYILNQHKVSGKTIELYKDEKHLVGEMMQMIRDQKKIFVCCNSKTKADNLACAITSEFGDEFSFFLLTSANSSKPESTDFIKDITKEILKYQVVIVSPAIGSGIDITFPDQAALFDCVIGFFEARITTHFDMDQQLYRVRHPKEIKVWITPQTFNFETELEPIKLELAQSGAVPDVRKEYGFGGEEKFNMEDGYLNLYARVLSHQRSSKNLLKENFRKLRIYGGWTVVDIENDKTLSRTGKVAMNKGKKLNEDEYIQGMLSADTIDSETKDRLKKERKRKALSLSDQRGLDRYFIELFYGKKIDADLLRMDDRGRYRGKIRMYRDILFSEFFPSEKVSFLRRAFTKAKIFDASNKFDENSIIDKASLSDFVAFCSSNREKINRVLDLEVRRDLTDKPVLQLRSFLNLCALNLDNIPVVSVGKDKIYRYQLDSQALREVHRWADKDVDTYEDVEDV